MKIKKHGENFDINNNSKEYISSEISNLEKLILQAKEEEDIWSKIYLYRLVLQGYSFLRNNLEWYSASNAINKRKIFFLQQKELKML